MFEEYCTEIGDYHDLYVQTDTLLFADVFESFRDTFIDIYRLILLISYLHLDNMASLLEKDRRKIRISNRHPYAIND